MDLIIPSAGLIFWQLIGFLALLFILIKFAWKPILASLAEREASIDGAQIRHGLFSTHPIQILISKNISCLKHIVKGLAIHC